MKKTFFTLFLFISLQAEAVFTGIVSFSNCSGAIVRFDSAHDSDQAIVLTAGHCAYPKYGSPMLLPNQYYFNEPIIDFAHLPILVSVWLHDATTGQKLNMVKMSRILYATLTGTDLALIELETTYQDLLAQGVRPLKLSSTRAQRGDHLHVPAAFHEQVYACRVESEPSFVEEPFNGHTFTWKDSLGLSSSCAFKGGDSGAPVLSTANEVVGVANTINDGGQFCTGYNPCEIDFQGQRTAIKGRAYAQQVDLIFSCLTNETKIDLNQTGCRLFH